MSYRHPSGRREAERVEEMLVTFGAFRRAFPEELPGQDHPDIVLQWDAEERAVGGTRRWVTWQGRKLGWIVKQRDGWRGFLRTGTVDGHLVSGDPDSLRWTLWAVLHEARETGRRGWWL